MPIKYDKFGLRRDKNLSDVEDSSLALTNILNDLALPGQTFIDKDLLVINNLAQTNVVAGNFVNIADSAVKTTQLRKVYSVLVEFPNPNVNVEPGFEFLIGDVDAQLINVAQIAEPEETGNVNEFFETVLSIQTPPVELSLQIGDTLDIANVPYTILAVIGVSDTQNIFTLKPQVTLNDQLQYYYLATGEEVKTLSGNGLDSYFFPSTEINPLITEVNLALDVISHPLTNNNPLLYGPFNFWDNGSFWLDRKIFNTNRFNDSAGGVYWEGYVNLDPLSSSSTSNYRALTNGYFMLDYYDEELEIWKVASRLAPTVINAQHGFRVEGTIYLGEIFIGLSEEIDILPELLFAEGVFHKVIENGVEVTPVDNRVFIAKRELDARESFEAGIDPIQSRLYSKLILQPPGQSDEGTDEVLTQALYDELESAYLAENPEADYYPGRFYVTTDISTTVGQTTTITFNAFPIADSDSFAKTAAFSIPRNQHVLETAKVRFVAWWPQQLQGWDEKLFVFSNVSTVFAHDFSVFTKTYGPDLVSSNEESLNNTFFNASKRGSNILEEGLNVENTLRVTSIPPISYRHGVSADDIQRNTLDDPRHDFEFNNMTPNFFGSPGVGSYQLPRGPFQAEKSIRNLTVRPGEYLITMWNEQFFNNKHYGTDRVLADLGLGLNCIDQVSPGELIRVSTPETQFLNLGDATQYDDQSAQAYYGGIDITEFSGRFGHDDRPFATAFKALTTDYTSLLDDLPGIGAIIAVDAIESHNEYTRSIFNAEGDDRWIRRLLNVRGDLTALPYIGLGSEEHYNVLDETPELAVTYFSGGASGSDLGFFNQLSIPNINLIDILATPQDAPKGALSDPNTRDYVYESIIVDNDTTLKSEFIKKDNFAVGFKTFSDLVYSPYFTTKRVLGNVVGGVVINAPNHGFQDRQIVVYHTDDSSDTNFGTARRYITFQDASGEYTIEETSGQGEADAPINLIVDLNGRPSNYQRKAIVNLIDADNFGLEAVTVLPLAQPKFYLDDNDTCEGQVRYIRDVAPSLGKADFTEAVVSTVSLPVGNIVVDLVENDDDSLPESILAVSYYKKFVRETDILNVVPYFATIAFREQVVSVTTVVEGVEYVITNPGTTDFTLIGAADNNPGTIFTATNIGSAGGTGLIVAYMGVDENGDPVTQITVDQCFKPLSQLEGRISTAVGGERTYVFQNPDRIRSTIPEGWVFSTTSQTYTKTSVIEPIALQTDNRVEFGASRFFANGVNRIVTKIFDAEATELEQDPNPYDAPLSGSWNIESVQYPNGSGLSYTADDTYEGAPVGPVTDDESSKENAYLELGIGQVFVKDDRPFDWSDINGSDASNYSQNPTNGKLFVDYESSVFGKIIDKDDTGYKPEAIQQLVDELFTAYALTGTLPGNYQGNIQCRVNKYFNTVVSKSMKNGIYGPAVSYTDLPMAIQDVNILPDGKVELQFNNFNNIPTTQQFTNHNGWLDSGILVDPWATEYVAIYSDKSVVDYSKLTFCQNVIPLEAVLGANAGATQINVPAGVAQTGYFLQFDGYLSNGTTITNITSGSPYDIIEISAPVLENIEPGYIITSAPDNLADYEICTLTLNTAPPFEGTEEGLATTTNAPELEVSELIFEGLEIKQTPTVTVTENDETSTQSLTVNYVDDQLVKTPYKLIAK